MIDIVKYHEKIMLFCSFFYFEIQLSSCTRYSVYDYVYLLPVTYCAHAPVPVCVCCLCLRELARLQVSFCVFFDLCDLTVPV